MWFCINNTREVYKDTQANPEVEVSVSSLEHVWIRLRGRAAFENNMEIRKGALENLIVKNQYETPENPIFEVFYPENAHGLTADFSDDPPYTF